MSGSQRLGRGLRALIPQVEEADREHIENIPVLEIEPNPFQPRKQFDQEKLVQLADSIAQHGVLEPIIVRQCGDRYQIVVGERRWRASQIAGLDTIVAVVKKFSDQQMAEVALIENLQRENLNPIEEAEGYQRLIDEFDFTQEQVANSIGKKRSSVTNSLRLLTLDQMTISLIIEGSISRGHAKVLLGVEDSAFRQRLARRVVDEQLSVRQLERLLKERVHVPRGTKELDPELISMQEELQQILGTKIRIDYHKGKGKIEIEYYSDEELERLLDMMRN